jgi:hypothetical protein
MKKALAVLIILAFASLMAFGGCQGTVDETTEESNSPPVPTEITDDGSDFDDLELDGGIPAPPSLSG